MRKVRLKPWAISSTLLQPRARAAAATWTAKAAIAAGPSQAIDSSKRIGCRLADGVGDRHQRAATSRDATLRPRQSQRRRAGAVGGRKETSCGANARPGPQTERISSCRSAADSVQPDGSIAAAASMPARKSEATL